MLEKFRAWASRQIVTDVPAELSACLTCGKVQCVEGQFRKCPNRLAQAAMLRAMSEEAAPTTSTQPKLG